MEESVPATKLCIMQLGKPSHARNIRRHPSFGYIFEKPKKQNPDNIQSACRDNWCPDFNQHGYCSRLLRNVFSRVTLRLLRVIVCLLRRVPETTAAAELTVL